MYENTCKHSNLYTHTNKIKYMYARTHARAHTHTHTCIHTHTDTHTHVRAHRTHTHILTHSLYLSLSPLYSYTLSLTYWPACGLFFPYIVVLCNLFFQLRKYPFTHAFLYTPLLPLTTFLAFLCHFRLLFKLFYEFLLFFNVGTRTAQLCHGCWRAPSNEQWNGHLYPRSLSRRYRVCWRSVLLSGI